MVHTIVSKTHGFSFQPTDKIFSSAMVVFMFSGYENFAVLQSSWHEAWSWKYASTMKGDRRYAPSDCFETFPFPEYGSDSAIAIKEAGEQYYLHRERIMKTHDLSMTQVYNYFHGLEDQMKALSDDMKEGILKLRALKIQLDTAVLSSYGIALDLQYGIWPHPYIDHSKNDRFIPHPSVIEKVMHLLLSENQKRISQ